MRELMTDGRGKRVVFTSQADAKLTFTAAPEGSADSIGTIQGYALVWNVNSTDRGGYKVRLAPHSATFTAPTRALYHHDWADVIGSTSNGTLTIAPDDYGVKVTIALPDTTTGRDVLALVKRGDVSGMSFAMTDVPKGTESEQNGETILTATAYTVDEVTVTPDPAFVQTTIEVKPERQGQKKLAATKEKHRAMLKLKTLTNSAAMRGRVSR